ncbi:MAG TPA: cytochrome c oxidase subunit 3 family protein, partial [Myxococcaceae bacterium]|nr:cytochrome c oxidase subunit 3 family protein [Myxococcaceae bacterium]
LLFAPLFTAYALYRYLYPEMFVAASRHLDVTLGTVNTLVLITSSLTVAMAVHFARVGKNKMVIVMIALSLLAGFAFLGIKGVEYAHKFHEGALPGKYYALKDLPDPSANMFFTIYFLATGVHAFHVVIGMGVLVWVAIRAAQNRISPEYYVPAELGGMYWHLVDLVWIFLYPLLYLI